MAAILKQKLSSSWDGRPFGHNRRGPKSGGCCAPFHWGNWGRGLPPYQMASWSIQPFDHNTPTLQTEQRSWGIGRTVIGPTCNGRPKKLYRRITAMVYLYILKIPNSLRNRTTTQSLWRSAREGQLCSLSCSNSRSVHGATSMLQGEWSKAAANHLFPFSSSRQMAVAFLNPRPMPASNSLLSMKCWMSADLGGWMFSIFLCEELFPSITHWRALTGWVVHQKSP